MTGCLAANRRASYPGYTKTRDLRLRVDGEGGTCEETADDSVTKTGRKVSLTGAESTRSECSFGCL